MPLSPVGSLLTLGTEKLLEVALAGNGLSVLRTKPLICVARGLVYFSLSVNTPLLGLPGEDGECESLCMSTWHAKSLAQVLEHGGHIQVSSRFPWEFMISIQDAGISRQPRHWAFFLKNQATNVIGVVKRISIFGGWQWKSPWRADQCEHWGEKCKSYFSFFLVSSVGLWHFPLVHIGSRLTHWGFRKVPMLLPSWTGKDWGNFWFWKTLESADSCLHCKYAFSFLSDSGIFLGFVALHLETCLWRS